MKWNTVPGALGYDKMAAAEAYISNLIAFQKQALNFGFLGKLVKHPAFIPVAGIGGAAVAGGIGANALAGNMGWETVHRTDKPFPWEHVNP